MSETSHTVDLEVSGDIQLLRDLLNRIELSSGVERVRVEVESKSPLYRPQEESADAEDNQGRSPADDPDANSGQSEPIEEPSDDHPSTGLIRDVDNGPTGEEYLEAKDNGDDPDPDEMIDIRCEPDTQKWYVAGTLYRSQGRLSTDQLVNMLEGTSWETARSSIYTAISELHDAGLLSKEKRGGEAFYQLTQLGRDYMEAKVAKTEGYNLTVADNVRKLNDE